MEEFGVDDGIAEGGVDSLEGEQRGYAFEEGRWHALISPDVEFLLILLIEVEEDHFQEFGYGEDPSNCRVRGHWKAD